MGTKKGQRRKTARRAYDTRPRRPVPKSKRPNPPEYHLERFRTSSGRWFVWKTDRRKKGGRRLLGNFSTAEITRKLLSGKWK